MTIVGYMYMCIYIYQDTGNIFYIVLNIVVCLLDMKLKIPVVKFRFMQDQNQLAVIWSEYNQKQIKQGCLSHPVQTYASNWILSLYVWMKIKVFHISNHHLVRYIIIPTYPYNKVAKAIKISCTIQSTSHFFPHGIYPPSAPWRNYFREMTANRLALFFLAATTQSIEPGTFCGLQLLIIFWLYFSCIFYTHVLQDQCSSDLGKVFQSSLGISTLGFVQFPSFTATHFREIKQGKCMVSF